MTNELGSDEHIQEFVSGGLKNYAFKIVNARTSETKTICRVRGITLNHSAAQLVNFDSIRDLILGTDSREIITVRTDWKIKRKMRCDGSGPSSADTVTIVSESEVYRVSFHKRRRFDDFDCRFRLYKERAERFHFSVCVMNVFKHPFTCMIGGVLAQ
jgi:hypothetical protein